MGGFSREPKFDYRIISIENLPGRVKRKEKRRKPNPNEIFYELGNKNVRVRIVDFQNLDDNDVRMPSRCQHPPPLHEEQPELITLMGPTSLYYMYVYPPPTYHPATADEPENNCSSPTTTKRRAVRCRRVARSRFVHDNNGPSEAQSKPPTIRRVR